MRQTMTIAPRARVRRPAAACLLFISGLPAALHAVQPGHDAVRVATSEPARGATRTARRLAKRGATRPTSEQGTDAAPCAPLEEAVVAAAEPLPRLQACLAAARCAITVEAARPISLDVLGVEKAGDRLTAIVDRAVGHLDCAAAALRDLPGNVESDSIHLAEDRIEMLRAFARMFRAIADPAEGEQAKDALTDACIGLALYADDTDPAVVEAAKLWQGVAYRRAGRPDRALQLLWPALGTEARSRVGFLLRTERCLALADLGRYAAAVSLALRLSARVDTWLAEDDAPARTRAKETLLCLRADIYRRWAAELRRQGHPERADAADREARKTLGDRPPRLTPDRLFLLDETIARLSDWKPEINGP